LIAFYRALFTGANLLMGGNEEVDDTAKVRRLGDQHLMAAQDLRQTINRNGAIFDVF